MESKYVMGEGKKERECSVGEAKRERTCMERADGKARKSLVGVGEMKREREYVWGGREEAESVSTEWER